MLSPGMTKAGVGTGHQEMQERVTNSCYSAVVQTAHGVGVGLGQIPVPCVAQAIDLRMPGQEVTRNKAQGGS